MTNSNNLPSSTFKVHTFETSFSFKDTLLKIPWHIFDSIYNTVKYTSQCTLSSAKPQTFGSQPRFIEYFGINLSIKWKSNLSLELGMIGKFAHYKSAIRSIKCDEVCFAEVSGK